MTTIDRDTIKDVSLTALEAIARDRMRNGTDTERAEWAKVFRALGVVAAAGTVTNDWAACLRCPLAFPTEKEYSHHVWTAHR